MKIYVASSWRNAYQPSVVESLRSAGHEVYDFRNPAPGNNGFAWSAIDPNWESWSPKEWSDALQHPIAQAGFDNDFSAMKWADVCVLVLPSGRSSHVEAGWMKGSGKKVIALVPEAIEPDLMYLCFDRIVLTTDELIAELSTVDEIQKTLLTN